MENQQQVIAQLFLNFLMQFIAIFLPAFAGSYSKDYLETITGDISRIRLKRLLISTITATIVIFAFSDLILDKLGLKQLMFFSYIAGLIGFQLLEEMSSIEGIKRCICIFWEFYQFKKEHEPEPKTTIIINNDIKTNNSEVNLEKKENTEEKEKKKSK